MKKLPEISLINFYLSVSGKNLIWNFFRSPRAKAGDRAGKKDKEGYLRLMINGKSYFVHRIMYKIHNVEWDELDRIDHIDCDKTNNHISNLRICNKYENMHNQEWKKRSIVGIKGIDVHPNTGMYRARVQTMNNRQTKSFEDLKDAVAWIESHRTKKHKVFANHG